MPNIKISSSKEEEFTVDLEVVKCSKTIVTMMEQMGISEGETISFPNISSVVLKKVIEWATHHKNEPTPAVERGKNNDQFDEWEMEFLKMEDEVLYDLITAANYLDIKGLMDVTCQLVANRIRKGKTAEEIRKIFNITNDYTPAEEEQIRQENAWCEGDNI